MPESSLPAPLDASPSICDGRELSNATRRTAETPTINDVGAGARNPGDISEGGEDDANMEKIIALLEEWAEWERGLEEEAKHCEVARSIKQAADREMPQLDLKNITPQFLEEKKCVVEGIENGPIEDTASVRLMKAPNTMYQSGDTAQPSLEIKQAWHREERKNPVATARRQALKVWAADQTRRRSSGDLQLDEGSDPQDVKECGVSQARRRSSTDATVDRHRKGEIRTGSDSMRRKNLGPGPVCAFTPQQVSFRETYQAAGPSATPPMPSIDRVAVPRDARYAVTTHKHRIPVRGGRETWERNAFTAPSPTSSSVPAAWSRASAWARSPSRETAGGILVKHSFFYGNGGRPCPARLASRENWAGANRSFESPWMRQLRQDTERNPDWWVGPQQHHHSIEEARNTKGRSLSRGQSRSGRRDNIHSTEIDAVGAVLRKEGRGARRDARGTSLWKEDRSYLAAGGCGENDNIGGGRGYVRRRHSKGGAAATAGYQWLDHLSFGDRLRCTPLSQGAWFEDSGSRGMRSDSPNALTGGDVQDENTEVNNGKNSDEAGYFSGIKTKVRDNIVERLELKGANARGGRESVLGGRIASGVDRSREGLRSVHDAILARLRGEIDSATREKIVLHAAEEARGVLERDGVRRTASRRAPAAASRASSSLKHKTAIPDSIDYDKVEVTLSLIELAARAAGPDAGRQMLTALECLEKMHQRASVGNEPVKSWSTSAEVGTIAKNSVVRRSQNAQGQRAIDAGEGKAIGNSKALPFDVNIEVDCLGRENGTEDVDGAVKGAMGAHADKHPVLGATFHDKTAAECIEATGPVAAGDIEVVLDGEPMLVEKAAAGDQTVRQEEVPAVVADVEMNTVDSTLKEINPAEVGGSLEVEGDQAVVEPQGCSKRFSLVVSLSSKDDTAMTDNRDLAAVPGSDGANQSINSWVLGEAKPPSRQNSRLFLEGAVDQDRVETDGNVQVGLGPLGRDLVGTVDEVADQKDRPDEDYSTEKSLTEQNLGGAQEYASQVMAKGIEYQKAKTPDVEKELKGDPLARKPTCKEGSEEGKIVQDSIDADPAPTLPCMVKDYGPCPALWESAGNNQNQIREPTLNYACFVDGCAPAEPLFCSRLTSGGHTRFVVQMRSGFGHTNFSPSLRGP